LKIASSLRYLILYVLLALLLLTTGGLIFFPEVVATGWHVVHGNSVKFHESVVPVPRGWWSFTHDDTLIIQKIQKKTDEDPMVIVGPFELAQGAVLDYDKLKTTVIDNKVKAGYQFVSESKITLGTHESLCLSFVANDSRHRLSIVCVVPDLHLTVMFTGNQTFQPDFDSIIRHMATDKR
jgi:hypothetical protein